MPFWNRTKPVEEKSTTLADPAALTLFAPVWADGVPTGAEAAWRCTTSRAAIRTISETLAVLPVHLYRRGEGQERERASDHPVESVIAGRAAPWLSASAFRREMTVQALLHGSAFARVIRVGGEVRELQPLPNSAVTVETDKMTGEPAYTIRLEGGGTERLDWSEVVHLRTLAGRSPTKDAARAIEFALTLEQHGSHLFKNGARPSGVLKVAKSLSKDAAERIRTAWQTAFGGENSGRVAVLEEGSEYAGLALSSTDGQYLENRKHQVEEVARSFGVPPVLLGDYGRATWSNSSEVGRLFLQYCILSWLTAWRDALETALLSEDERETLFIEANADALTRGDVKSRYEAYAKAGGGAAWLTPDELRAMDNRPPTPGGDQLRQPLNTSTQTDEANDGQ